MSGRAVWQREGLPSCLPRLRACAAIRGHLVMIGRVSGVPLTGVAGDSLRLRLPDGRLEAVRAGERVSAFSGWTARRGAR